MKKVNFERYKFHCSLLPNLMTESRVKLESLSDTAKAELLEIWIKERFGREKILDNKFINKGTAVESDSLELYCEVTKRKLFKNIKQLENDYLIGTPDVCKPLIDIKSSWDIWTYFAVDEKKAIKTYFWQLAGYAYLLKTKNAELVYALVSTPLHIVEDEIYRLSFRVGAERAEETRINYEYDDIPKELRIKRFKISFNDEHFKQIETKIKECRQYLAALDIGGGK